MKTGTLSVIIALIGIAFVIWFNFQTSELFLQELHTMHTNSDLSPTLVSNGIMHKYLALFIGFSSFFLGYKSIRNKNLEGLIGTILAIILIILSFVPIWTFMIPDTVDFNVQY